MNLYTTSSRRLFRRARRDGLSCRIVCASCPQHATFCKDPQAPVGTALRCLNGNLFLKMTCKGIGALRVNDEFLTIFIKQNLERTALDALR